MRDADSVPTPRGAVWLSQLTPDDGMELRTLRLQALTQDPDAFGSSFEDEAGFPTDRWPAWIRKGAFFVARHDGCGIGLAGLTRGDHASAELLAVWIQPEFRGFGLAQHFVHHALSWCEEEGVVALRLWVTESNAGARRLYERLGFAETGRSKVTSTSRVQVEMTQDISPTRRMDTGVVSQDMGGGSASGMQ